MRHTGLQFQQVVILGEGAELLAELATFFMRLGLIEDKDGCLLNLIEKNC